MKDIQLHIEETESFIIEMIIFFTPTKEAKHETEVPLKNCDKEHHVLDLQEELKLLELELIPLTTWKWGNPAVQ